MTKKMESFYSCKLKIKFRHLFWVIFARDLP